MSARRFTVRRFLGYSLGGVGVATGGCLMLPKETLPSPVLNYVVLCEGIGRLLRCCYVGLVLLVDYKWSLHGKEEDQAAWDEVHLRSAKRLVELAETNGALYVKSGQGFAAMNHLLPGPYWKTMGTLQDAVLFRPVSEVEAVIEADLGRKPSDIFEHFDESPIAAASLAQVHKARVAATPTTPAVDVAVKVQYIDVAERFHGDMATITSMLKVCGVFFPGYDFGLIVRRTEETLKAELDFLNEARNSERCRADMKAHFGDAITTPTVRWDLCTKRVMVTEFIDNAVKASDSAGIKGLGLNLREAATLFADCFAYQIFQTGFVHADPHPGNVFVRRNPAKPTKTQLVLLDHGLYVEVDAEHRGVLSRLWTAAATHNDAAMKSVCRELALSEQSYDVLASMILCFPYRTFSPFQRHATEADLDEMRHMAARNMHLFTEILEHLPPEYALILRNINTVRSVSKQMGNPVSRTGRMLCYSMASQSAGLVGHLHLYWALLRLWGQETVVSLMLAFARWKEPEMMGVVDEMFELG